VVPDAGHFIDLESSQARRATGEIERSFLFGTHPVVESMPASKSRAAGLFQAS
jgi:hypothetical protein